MKYQSIICNLQFEKKMDISRDKDKIKDKNVEILGKEEAVWFPLMNETIKSAEKCNDSLLSRSKANKSVYYFDLSGESMTLMSLDTMHVPGFTEIRNGFGKFENYETPCLIGEFQGKNGIF